MAEPGAYVGAGPQSGIVAHWNEARGMGFITPAGGGQDIYVHRSQLLDSLSLGVGQEVNYLYSWDAQANKAIALNVTKATMLVVSPDATAENGTPMASTQVGTVSSWVESRGMGFISPEGGGQDFFVHRSHLLDGGSLVVGAQVTFEPSWDARKNKPMALRVNGAIAQQSQVGGPAAVYAEVDGMSGGSFRSSPYGSSVGEAPSAIRLSGSSLSGLGIVSAWVEERGMGFITPAEGGPDLFVHRSNLLDGGSLVLGAQVTFEPSWDARKNKGAAINVNGAVPEGSNGAARAMGGGSFRAGMPADGRESGTVSHWTEERGMGFITPIAWGQDIFVHRSCLQDCQTLTVGARVTFKSEWEASKGKPIATSVCTGTALSSHNVGTLSLRAGVAAAVGPGMATGTVSAWVEERGMGFITPSESGPDLFVHRSNLLDGGSLQLGSQVSFEPSWDAQKNKGAAINVSGAIPSPPSVPPPVGVKGSSKGSVIPPPLPNWRSGGNAGFMGQIAGSGAMKSGTVSHWVEERGMGFLTPAEGGPDLFVHRSNLLDGGSLRVGSQVAFQQSWDMQKNKAAALNVSGAIPQPAAQQLAITSPTSSEGFGAVQVGIGEIHTGIVTHWVEERGMGFIKPTAGGQDVFVHRSMLHDAQTLAIGAFVTFETSWDGKKGKPYAKAVVPA